MSLVHRGYGGPSLLSVIGAATLTAAVALDHWSSQVAQGSVITGGLVSSCLNGACSSLDFSAVASSSLSTCTASDATRARARSTAGFVILMFAIICGFVAALCQAIATWRAARRHASGPLLFCWGGVAAVGAACTSLIGGTLGISVYHGSAASACVRAAVCGSLTASGRCSRWLGRSSGLWIVALVLLAASAVLSLIISAAERSDIRRGDTMGCFASCCRDDDGEARDVNCRAPVKAQPRVPLATASGPHAVTPEPPGAASNRAMPRVTATQVPAGYTWDEGSGYYYSAETNYFYDAHSGMYFDNDARSWFQA